MKDSDYCHTHRADLDAAVRFGSPEQARAAARGVRRKAPTLQQLAMERVEAAAEHLLGPYFQSLGIVGWTEDNEPIIDMAKASMEVGRSNSGKVKLTNIADLGARIAAAEKLMDRTLGRPTQRTEELSSGGGSLQEMSDEGLEEMVERSRELRSGLREARERMERERA